MNVTEYKPYKLNMLLFLGLLSLITLAKGESPNVPPLPSDMSSWPVHIALTAVALASVYLIYRQSRDNFKDLLITVQGFTAALTELTKEIKALDKDLPKRHTD